MGHPVYDWTGDFSRIRMRTAHRYERDREKRESYSIRRFRDRNEPHIGALCIWYPCSLMNFIARRFRTRSPGHIPIYSVSCRRDDVDGKVWRAITILSLSVSLFLSDARSWIYMKPTELSIGYDRRVEQSRLVSFFRVSPSCAELPRTRGRQMVGACRLRRQVLANIGLFPKPLRRLSLHSFFCSSLSLSLHYCIISLLANF